VVAIFEILKACFVKNFKELAIPQDLAKLINILMLAGPGMPACISS